MDKLLVVGASGLLGSKIVSQSTGKYKIFGTYCKNAMKFDDCITTALDIKERDKTVGFIKSLKPDCVILTAAITQVDYCETHREFAYAVNVEGTKAVATGCKDAGAKLIYVSTDYVFDGERGYYSEADIPNPTTYYSWTKLEGERIVQSTCSNYAIARVCVLYGWQPPGARNNFVTWLVEKLQSNEEVKLFVDSYCTPTFADNAAEAILKIVEKNKTGIYHTTGSECINRYEFGKKVVDHFNLNKDLIKPVKMVEMQLPAKRPKNSCLKIEKAERELGVKMLNIDEGLKVMKMQCWK